MNIYTDRRIAQEPSECCNAIDARDCMSNDIAVVRNNLENLKECLRIIDEKINGPRNDGQNTVGTPVYSLSDELKMLKGLSYEVMSAAALIDNCI